MLKHGCFTSPFFLRPIVSLGSSLSLLLVLFGNLSCESPKAQQQPESVPQTTAKLRPRSSVLPSQVIDFYLEEDSRVFSAKEIRKLEVYLFENRSAYLPCLMKIESIHRSLAVQLQLSVKDRGLHLVRMIQSPKDRDLEICLKEAFLKLNKTSAWSGRSVNIAFIAAQIPESLPWWAGRSWSKAIGLTLEKEDSKLRPDVLE